ncbi:MAG TPA: FAD-binding oxidoreductase [Acidimicrobiia bacterium]|nr:FAD-binding oxidoreductase [Acidimicrobiia bacterium]
MANTAKVRKFWGWGYEGEGPTRDQQEQMAKTLAGMFDLDEIAVSEPPTIDQLELPEPRIEPPASLAALCTTEPAERAGHTYGKSFRDIVRAFRRDFAHPPDVVVAPRTEADVADVLDWCAEAGAAAIPYGGGSSVVGGVECDVGDTYRGAVSVDLRHLDQVLDIDRGSRAARIQAGVYGPALEDQLRPHDLTLRHFPQSFECSTLGGWIATRSGGHYATLYTHIDDFVESLRVVTPRGVVESRRLPGSGAGPSPDRLFLGSEGILGVITEAWMRLQDRPRFRASAAARFPRFEQGVEATRALAQSGLHPSNCRLLDATEAMVTGADDGSAHLLLIAFESADHPLDAWLARAAELARDHGGEVPDEALRTRTDDSSREGSAGAWRSAFLRAPYTRDALVAMGMVNETFETAITWDGFDALYGDVMDAVRGALVDIGAPKGVVTCRFTHVYPDGPAPYFTVIAPGRPGAQLEQWAVVKDAASEALVRHGATITHHHAVGRDHRRWYDRQRPPLFAETLRSAKATLDPHATLNPGVLIDP